MNLETSVSIGATQHPIYSLRQLVLYPLKLGTVGFGGPVALVGYMYRDLVEQRHWISEADYKEGLALAQLIVVRVPAFVMLSAGGFAVARFLREGSHRRDRASLRARCRRARRSVVYVRFCTRYTATSH